MSDAPFQSLDSQADWSALGDRMRRNRSWLLLMFVGLGAYMAAQGWARMQREGVELPVLPSNVALTGSTPATALPAPSGEQQTTEPQPEVAPPSEPKRAPAGQPRTSTGPVGIAARQPPSQLAGLAESAGEWVAAWQRRQEESRQEGWRVAAAALAKYARRPTREVGVLVASPPADSSPALPRVEPSATLPPPAPSVATEEPTASGGPQLSAPRSGLSLHNPGQTGVVVHYVVNGQDQTLRPGESRKLPAGRWLVEFHRGGPYGDAAHSLASGHYRFEIGKRGWELLSSAGP